MFVWHPQIIKNVILKTVFWLFHTLIHHSKKYKIYLQFTSPFNFCLMSKPNTIPTSTLCGWLKASSQKLLDCNRTQDTSVKLITLTENNNSNTKRQFKARPGFLIFQYPDRTILERMWLLQHKITELLDISERERIYCKEADISFYFLLIQHQDASSEY